MSDVPNPRLPMTASSLDPDPALSTTEVGALFDVHPSTVKRWCDRGRLRFTRTGGGHRRIPLSEALHLAREEGISMPLQSFGERAGAVWDVTRNAVVRGDYEAARALAVEWLAAGDLLAIGELFVHLGRQPGADLSRLADAGVREFMRAVGRRWEEGRLGVGHEHLLSETVCEALLRLRPLPHADGDGARPNPVALVGCAEGELHSLGARCVRLVLEDRGWAVRFLGPDVPMEEWTALQRETRATLVAVSFSSLRAPADALRCVRRLSDDYDPNRPYALALGGGDSAKPDLPAHAPFRDLRYFTDTAGLVRWMAPTPVGSS